MAGGGKDRTKAPTQILECVPCKDTDAAKFQDERYGPNKRVHNPASDALHCTVCGGAKAYKD